MISGCAIPTDTPNWDTEWTASAGTVGVTAADVLPDDVNTDGGTFRVPIFPATTSLRLSDFCPSCPTGTGPKPAFDETVEVDPSTPVDIVGGALLGGLARFRLSHSWGFDPLRPGGTEFGTITVEVTDAMGAPFGSTTLDGADTDFPSGSTRDVSVGLEAGEFQGGGTIRIRVVSPVGSDATVDPATELSVTVLTGSFLRASSLDVSLGDAEVESDPLQLDLTDVDSEVESQVRRGALILFTNNTLDLGIGGALDVLPVQGNVISRALAIPKGQQEQRFDLSLEEIQTILGQLVNLRARGRVLGGEDGIVRLRPQDRLDLRLDLELTVRIGG